MAIGPRYQVPFRRRRDGKTNYHKRLGLMLSEWPRVVVRKTGRNLIVQLVEHGTAGDRTLISANALELKTLGYKGPTGNTPAAYLTGLQLAIRKGCSIWDLMQIHEDRELTPPCRAPLKRGSTFHTVVSRFLRLLGCTESILSRMQPIIQRVSRAMA
jgi:ribosomal protein L18